MSHYIAEVVIPPTDDAEQSIKQVMERFCKEKYDDDGNEIGRDKHADWWDWWVIGGRFSGHKLECSIGEDSLNAFRQELIDRKVTVAGVTCGKQEISPRDQIPMVDALWRERFPGRGDKCLLFTHAWDQYGKQGIFPGDICRVSEIPDELNSTRLIVATPHWDKANRHGEVSPSFMLASEFWNGVTWQDTDFNRNTKAGLARAVEHFKKTYREGWYAENCPNFESWLVVTVDYHN